MRKLSRRALLGSLGLGLIPCRAATPAPVIKLEPYLLLPEPKAMRSAYSIMLMDSRRTVATPAMETAAGVEVYSKEEFAKLGISPESFAEKARARADQRLARLVPEFIKDDSGTTRYAVYRGESPLICTLLVAPSLGKLVSTLFGSELWAATPDRNSLYLFPAKPEAVEEYSSDLAQRFEDNAFAASPEFFLLQQGKTPRAVAQFVEE